MFAAALRASTRARAASGAWALPVRQAVVLPAAGVSSQARAKKRPNTSPELELVLLRDVEKLGDEGQCVKVKRGYARNFLVPKGLAVIANTANRARYGKAKSESGSQSLSARQQELQRIARLMERTPVVFKRNPANTFRIDAQLISEAYAKQLHLNVPEQRIKLSEPLTTLGEHPVMLSLSDSITKKVTVVVSSR